MGILEINFELHNFGKSFHVHAHLRRIGNEPPKGTTCSTISLAITHHHWLEYGVSFSHGHHSRCVATYIYTIGRKTSQRWFEGRTEPFWITMYKLYSIIQIEWYCYSFLIIIIAVRQSSSCLLVVLWTDCGRETGEHHPATILHWTRLPPRQFSQSVSQTAEVESSDQMSTQRHGNCLSVHVCFPDCP